MAYIAKASWAAHIASILASQNNIPASTLRGFETDLLDSFVHSDDLAGISAGHIYQATYHVDSLNGDDGTAVNGDVDKPWQTIEAACIAADSVPQGCVYVHPGTHTITSTVDNYTNIFVAAGAKIEKSTSGPMFDGVNGLQIFGFGIFDHSSTGGIYTNSGSNTNPLAIVEGDIFYSSGGLCFDIQCIGTADPIKIKANLIFSSADYAVYIGTGQRNITVEANQCFSSAESAIFADTDSSMLLQVNINHLESTTGHGIEIYAGDDLIANLTINIAYTDFLFAGKYGISITRTNGDCEVKIVANKVSLLADGRMEIDAEKLSVVSVGTSVVCRVRTVEWAMTTGGKLSIVNFTTLAVAQDGQLEILGNNSIDYNGPLVLINGASSSTVTIHGLLENTHASSTAHCVSVMVASDLIMMPGARLKTNLGSSGKAIADPSSFINIKSLGKHFINSSITGTPTYLVGSGADTVTDINI